MMVFRYYVFIILGTAFCIGCGDSSSQSWENGRSQTSAGKADLKSDEVADNDTASQDAGPVKDFHGMGGPHATTNPHAGMSLPAEAPNAAPENNGRLDLDTIHWIVPKTWGRKAAGVLLAEYAVPKTEGDTQDARLTVSQFGGTVEANIDRWKAQFGKKLDKQNQETFDVGGVKVTLADLSGTFDDARGPMAPTVTRPDYRMLGAVIEVPGQPGLFFIKCYGPAKTIASRADEVKAFIRSMKIDK